MGDRESEFRRGDAIDVIIASTTQCEHRDAESSQDGQGLAIKPIVGKDADYLATSGERSSIGIEVLVEEDEVEVILRIGGFQEGPFIGFGAEYSDSCGHVWCSRYGMDVHRRTPEQIGGKMSSVTTKTVGNMQVPGIQRSGSRASWL